MFRGEYNGSSKHPNDYDRVLERAWQAGLAKVILTVGTMNEADSAMELAKKDGKYGADGKLQGKCVYINYLQYKIGCS